MFEIDNLIATYGAAWLEEDEDLRRALLTRCWAEDGLYEDPLGKVRGRAALVAHIGAFHAARPGARIEISSGALAFADNVHFGWHMRAADGAIELQGVDFGQIRPDGRLARITGFFGSPPPLPA